MRLHDASHKYNCIMIDISTMQKLEKAGGLFQAPILECFLALVTGFRAHHLEEHEFEGCGIGFVQWCYFSGAQSSNT